MEIRTQRIRYLDIHHTAGHELNTQAVRQEHLNIGWGDIGYNSVIESNGTVGTGRDVKWAGAHDPGVVPGESYAMNQVAYAISSIGNFQSPNADTMSEVQFRALLGEAYRVCKLYAIPITRVRRHKDQYATDCPGDNFPWARLIAELGKLLSGGEAINVDTVIVEFSAKDSSIAGLFADKFGSCAVFNRNAGPAVHPDAMKSNMMFIIGGPDIPAHPNRIYLSGNSATDTAKVAVDWLVAHK